MTNYKQLCAELVRIVDALDNRAPLATNQGQALDGYAALAAFRDVANRARAELAKPEPERLTVKQISDLPQHRENYIAEDDRNGEIQLDGHFSRADLQQLADSIPTLMRTAAKID